MEAQINHISKTAYQGKNQAELLAEKKKRGYESNSWLTFLQAKDLGLHLKAGSKGVGVFKGYESFSTIKKDSKGTEKTVIQNRPLGWATVFNLDCTEKKEVAK